MNTAPACLISTTNAKTAFLELLPRIQRHAAIYFADVRCADQRADRIADTVALCWAWHLRLLERGKNLAAFPMTFIILAARAVKCGRRISGSERSKDVMSPTARRRYGFTVQSLDSSGRRSYASLHGLVSGQRELDAYEARLHDNTVSNPCDAAAFRIDFPAFLAELPERQRRMALFLSLDHGTKTTAARFGISPGRVSQLRRRWCEDWRRGQGERCCAR